MPVDVGAEAILAVRPEGVGLLDELGLGRRADLPADHLGAHPGRRRRPPAAAPHHAGHPRRRRARCGIRARSPRPPSPPSRPNPASRRCRRWSTTSRWGRWCGSGSATRSPTDWSSRCSAASTPGGPTRSRCARPCRSSPRQLAERRVAGHGRRRGQRRRHPGLGPRRAGLHLAAGRGRAAAAGARRLRPLRGAYRRHGARPDAHADRVRPGVRCGPGGRAARGRRRGGGPAGGEGGAAVAGDRAGGRPASWPASRPRAARSSRSPSRGSTPPAGSGLLVAAGERLATKGVTFTTGKWPVESGGRLLLRASVGRAGEPQALQLADDGPAAAWCATTCGC